MFKFKYIIIMALSLTFQRTANADIVISGTRIIYPASSSEVMVHLENKGSHPLLVQSWIDDGNEETNPQEIKTPFLISPPITRINENQGQTVKISYLEGNLPKDRESIYWFNTLEVPPKSKDEGNTNHLQLAFRTRIKFFYRPNGLKGTSEEGIKNLKWSINKTNGNVSLTVKNESPYYISLNSISVVSSGKTYSVECGMIPPMNSASYEIKSMNQVTKGIIVKYSGINDFGGSSKFESVI